MARLQLRHLLHRDLIVAMDPNVEPGVQLAQALNQVPGERIVVVDEENHDGWRVEGGGWREKRKDRLFPPPSTLHPPRCYPCFSGMGWALLTFELYLAFAVLVSSLRRQSVEAVMSYQPP